MNHSVLIVDDSATTRALIRRTIQLVGMASTSITEAADGAAGLSALEARPVDLVLASERLKKIPVLIVSADPNTERLELLKAQGVAGVLRKPFTPEEFRAAIRPIFGELACRKKPN
jgi:two-component system chemotaxis response regulator CheY